METVELSILDFALLMGVWLGSVVLMLRYEMQAKDAKREAKDAKRKADDAKRDERWRWRQYCRKREFGLHRQGDCEASREARTIANALMLDDDMHQIVEEVSCADAVEAWLQEGATNE